METQVENEDAISQAEPVMTEAAEESSEEEKVVQEAVSSGETATEEEALNKEAVQEEILVAQETETSNEIAHEATDHAEEETINEAKEETVAAKADEAVEEPQGETENSFNVEADGALTSSKNDLTGQIAATEQEVEKELSEIVDETPVASESPAAVSPVAGQEADNADDINSVINEADAVNLDAHDSDAESDWVDEELDSKPEPKYTSSQKSNIASLVESLEPEQVKSDVIIGEEEIVPESYVQEVADKLSQVQITEKEEEKKEPEKERLEDIESVTGFVPSTNQMGDNLSAEVERVLSDVEAILDDVTVSQSVTESSQPSVSINQGMNFDA